MTIKKRNKNCDGFQHFASNGQNLGHYAKAKANQKRKKLREKKEVKGDFTLKWGWGERNHSV